MQILNINKSDRSGGAAVAAMRLVNALLKTKVDVRFLVEEKLSDEKFVIVSRSKWIEKKMNFLNFVVERLYFLPHEREKSVRFAFSPAFAGHGLASHKETQGADILHFHWFNQGFLSLKNFRDLLALKKPVVWTLHDMWAFTGGCHYNGDCRNYEEACGNCPYLKHPKPNDLSFKTLQQKQFIQENEAITFVTCSEWLAQKARSSSLLKGKRIVSIPNPIDTKHFAPTDREAIKTELNLDKSKKIVLFGAANMNDTRKGFAYLKDALQQLHRKEVNDIQLLFFGKANQETLDSLPFPHTHVPFADHNLIVKLYGVADVMVLPSLQDNLPNTVMEAMACGTPVVAFETGGIPEMITHKENGFLVPVKDSDRLAEGILYLLKADVSFREEARTFVLENYAETVVAQKYIEEYERLLNN